MAKKKPFVLRLSPEMMEAMERWAADEFRSLNGQIEYVLSQALKETNRLKIQSPDNQENDSIKPEN